MFTHAKEFIKRCLHRKKPATVEAVQHRKKNKKVTSLLADSVLTAGTDSTTKQRGEEFKFLNELISIIAERPFHREIRSEECGFCTNEIADKLLSLILPAEEPSYSLIIRLLSKLTHSRLRTLPRFTLKILNHTLDLIQKQCDAHPRNKGTFVPSLHKNFATAIKELEPIAIQEHTHGNWLQFCRLAEPIRLIKDRYFKICETHGIPAPQRPTKCFASIESAIENLVEQQKNENYVNNTRDIDWLKKLSMPDNRPHKILLSGGWACEHRGNSFSAKTDINKVLLQLVHYSETQILAYSRHCLAPKTDHEFDIFFNSVDLSFRAKLDVIKELEFASMKDADILLQNRAKFMSMRVPKPDFPYCYLLGFRGAITKDAKDRYYFLAMCHNFLEMYNELDFNAFETIFWNPDLFE